MPGHPREASARGPAGVQLTVAAGRDLAGPQEARRAIEDASQFINRLQAEANNKGHHELLITQILFREAEALITGKPEPNPAEAAANPTFNASVGPTPSRGGRTVFSLPRLGLRHSWFLVATVAQKRTLRLLGSSSSRSPIYSTVSGSPEKGPIFLDVPSGPESHRSWIR